MSGSPDIGQTRIEIASTYAATMLVIYEHLLTLDTEVKEMWNRKITPTTVLFFVNRYVLLLTITVTFLEQTKWNSLSNSSCSVMVRIQMIFNAILGIAAAVYAAIRVRALFCRQRVLTALTLLLGLISPCIITWVWATSTPELILIDGLKVPIAGCGVEFAVTDVQYVFLLLGSRVASLLADIIVVVSTVIKAYRAFTVAQRCGGSLTQRIMSIFIQSGVLYFMIMVALNVLGIAIIRETSLDIVIPTWTATITSIIISRFILELRSAYSGPQMIGSTPGTD